MKNCPALVLAVLSVACLRGAEPWADDRLPVKDGLALWLDAGKADPTTPGEWKDGSGNKRHARQDDPALRPTHRLIFPAKAFHFDGRPRHIAIDAAGWTMREATVIVFARVVSNDGGFRALVSASKPGANDYATGFNLDLGSAATPDGVTSLNAEGSGFGGERNLLSDHIPFGKTFSAAAVIGRDKVTAWLDDVAQGSSTGTRIIFGLDFNAAGDLFATEQEGATWLANGNPFDELLHIQTGRHHGFPPRHPRHLPDVVDEPSTFDYGPQHQSTVGLCFAPLPTDVLASIRGMVRVTQGRHVQAGDRFETMRPGYQIVKNQLAAPRFPVAVRKLGLDDDGRTLVITTEERMAAVGYAISIEADLFKSGSDAPHFGQIDLLTDLTGLDAEWT